MANKKQVNETAKPSNEEKVVVPVTVSKNGNSVLTKVKSLGRTELLCHELRTAVESVKQGYDAVLWYFDENGQRRDAIILSPFYVARDGVIKIIATSMSDIRNEAASLPVRLLHKGVEVTVQAVKKVLHEVCEKRTETDRRRAKLDRVTCDKVAECPQCGYRFAVTKHLV